MNSETQGMISNEEDWGLRYNGLTGAISPDWDV